MRTKELRFSREKLTSKKFNSFKKLVCMGAEKVLLWAGRDHEEEDVLAGFLGKGTNSYSKAAFEFCETMAAVSDPHQDLAPIRKSTTSDSQRSKWCHLVNLLYRPWFRTLPLLPTNYLTKLPPTLIVCGAQSISWPNICITTERMRAINPAPYLLSQHCEDQIAPGMMIENGVEWLKARERFGFSTLTLMVQIYHFKKDDSSENAKRNGRIDTLIGLVADMYELDSSKARFNESVQQIRFTASRNKASAATLANLETPMQVPFPPVPISYSRSLDPEHQTTYIHSPVYYDEIRLFRLLPHRINPLSVVKSTLIHTRSHEAPTFAYVSNAAFKNYDKTSLILIDGQSFRIPEAIAIFLHHLQDTEEERLLFL